MANSTYDFAQLNLNMWEMQNCTQIVEIWHYLEHDRTGNWDNFIKSSNQTQVYRSIVQGFERFFKLHSLQPPPENQEFWDWTTRSSSLRSYTWASGVKHCPSAMCEASGWEGSPDLVGVGMLLTYVIQAILVTFYLLAMLADRLDRLSPRIRSSRVISRTLLSVRHSTAEFLSASALFSISLFVASILSISHYKTLRPMLWILAIIVPLNSVLPVVILHVSSSTMLRRSKGRLLTWLIIDGLLLGLTTRSLSLFVEFTGYTQLDEIGPCANVKLHGIAVFLHILAGVLILGITGYIVDFLITVFCDRPGMIVRIPDIVQWGLIGACMCTMWGLMGWLLHLAIEIQSRAGDNNKDNEWTFGQVLSLTTWAPFIVEFAYIWWEDPLQALNGRIMAPYEVVVSSRQQSLLEMRPSGRDEERGQFQRLGQSPDS